MSEASSSGRTRLVIGGLTDVGRQRKHNEDHILIKPELRVFAVADGMGGHNAGDVASKLTTTSLCNFFEATKDGSTPVELPEEYESYEAAAQRLVAGVRKSNLDVFSISNTHEQHHGMGSTIVALHLTDDGIAHIAHVGDSRCYRIRDGEIEQLTRDHSLINDALDLKPDLTRQELARLPKNIITRALGMKDVVKVDIRSDKTLPGDTYLLCSDGLTGMVSPSEILEVVTFTDDPNEACELLIAEANQAGGTDNISALIIRVADEESEEETASGPDVDISVSPAPGEAAFDETLPGEAAFDETLPGEAAFDETLPSEAVFAEIAPDETLSRGAALKETVPSEATLDGSAPGEAALDESASGEVALDGTSPGEVTNLLIATGSTADLDARAPLSMRPTPARRCSNCFYDLVLGNLFCVECGARIEEPPP